MNVAPVEEFDAHVNAWVVENHRYGGLFWEEPFGGDQFLENADYEMNARYDYLSEAYGSEIDAEYEDHCYAEEMAEQAATQPVAEFGQEVDDEFIPF